MTPDQLYKDALEAKQQGAVCGMTLVFPHGSKKPHGFPRGELLCETDTAKVYTINPDKVIKWLTDNGLVQP